MSRGVLPTAALLFMVVLACQTPTVAPTPTSIRPSPTPSPTATVPTEQARREHFQEVWSAVKQNYYRSDFGGVDWDRARADFEPRIVQAASAAAYHAAIAAMVERLGDGHSGYLSPFDAYAQDRQLTSSPGYAGIGFQSRWRDGVYVHAVYPDNPGARAGLQRRDRILAIDGTPPLDINAVLSIRGAEGTTVHLTVRSPGQASRDMTLTRAAVKGTPVPEAHRLEAEPRIGYLFVPTFGVREMGRLAHDELGKIIGSDLAGLVIDLRGNDGGTVEAALEFLGAFVMGDVLTFEGPTLRDKFKVPERPLYGRLASVPLAVLVDRNNQSGGELVPAVLQSLRRATVIGEPTAGVTHATQTVNFPDGSRLYVAAALGRLPDGTLVERVTPDVRIDGGWVDYVEREDPYILRALAILKSAAR